jgi:integrase
LWDRRPWRRVASWLAHWRATTLAASDRKPATRELYANLSRVHLETGALGETTLARLRPSDVEALILALRAKGLSDSTIRTTYTVLRSGLDGAVRDGLLARNPAASVKRPGVERREARHLDAGDVNALLRAAEGSRYHPVLVLIAGTGLWRGEALALRWSDVDLDAGTLNVRFTIARVGGELTLSAPKTARSRREVPLIPASWQC